MEKEEAAKKPATGKQEKILIVGAGGFMGSHFADAALREGMEVYAGVRESTSRRYLTDPRLHFVTFDFDKPETLAPALGEAMPEGGWDYIIYNLGATKCLNFADFNRINYSYLRSFIEALRASGATPRRFLLMSSLSAMGPGDEKGYTPLTTSRPPMPNTRYGASKLKAEMEMQMSGMDYIIFRPTGIYGPRDKDYLLELKSLKKGFDFSAGLRRQMLTFIYGPDLADAAMAALRKAPAGKTYIIAEDRAYSQKEYRSLAAEALQCRHPLSIAVPLWGVRLVSAVAEKIGVARNKPSTLNSDKYNIMKQRNWTADVTPAREDFGFTASTTLAEGLRESVEWYRREKWL